MCHFLALGAACFCLHGAAFACCCVLSESSGMHMPPPCQSKQGANNMRCAHNLCGLAVSESAPTKDQPAQNKSHYTLNNKSYPGIRKKTTQQSNESAYCVTQFWVQIPTPPQHAHKSTHGPHLVPMFGVIFYGSAAPCPQLASNTLLTLVDTLRAQTHLRTPAFTPSLPTEERNTLNP